MQAGDMIMLQTGEFCGLAGSAGASAPSLLHCFVYGDRMGRVV